MDRRAPTAHETAFHLPGEEEEEEEEEVEEEEEEGDGEGHSVATPAKNSPWPLPPREGRGEEREMSKEGGVEKDLTLA